MSGVVNAQSPHIILSEFFVYQDENLVRLQWTIKEGRTCNDIRIERAGNAKNFSYLGLISGVCGAPDQSVTYRYVDSIPLQNQVNYYRLEMGSQGYSEPVSIETRMYNNKEYIIKGNPSISGIEILFKNEKAQMFEFRVFDMRGHLVVEESTSSDRIKLPTNDLRSGMYIFRGIGASGSKITGKFAVM